jgi:hypothetical protein
MPTAWRSARAAGLAALLAAAIGGCDGERLSARCKSTVTGASSPGAGALTLTGQFYANESIIVRDERTSTQVASGTPASDRTSFSFTGLTAGIHTFEIIASCDNGQQDIGGETVTIQ